MADDVPVGVDSELQQTQSQPMSDLVQELASDDFETRQQAFMHLWNTFLVDGQDLDLLLGDGASRSLSLDAQASLRWLRLLTRLGSRPSELNLSSDEFLAIRQGGFGVLLNMMEQGRWTDAFAILHLLTDEEREYLLQDYGSIKTARVVFTAIEQNRLEVLPHLADLIFSASGAIKLRQYWHDQGIPNSNPDESIHATTTIGRIALLESQGAVDQALELARSSGSTSEYELIAQRNYRWQSLLDAMPTDPSQYKILTIEDLEKATRACNLARWVGDEDLSQAWAEVVLQADAAKLGEQSVGQALCLCRKPREGIELLYAESKFSAVDLANVFLPAADMLRIAGLDPEKEDGFEDWLQNCRMPLDSNERWTRRQHFLIAGIVGIHLRRLGETDRADEIDQMLVEYCEEFQEDYYRTLFRLWRMYSNRPKALETLAFLAERGLDSEIVDQALVETFPQVGDAAYLCEILRKEFGSWRTALAALQRLAEGALPEGKDIQWLRQFALSQTDVGLDASELFSTFAEVAEANNQLDLALEFTGMEYQGYGGLLLRSQLFAKAGEPELAVQLLMNAFERNPEQKLWAVQMATWLRDAGKHEEARRMDRFFQLVPLQPADLFSNAWQLSSADYKSEAMELARLGLSLWDMESPLSSSVGYTFAEPLAATEPLEALQVARFFQCAQMTNLQLLQQEPSTFIRQALLAQSIEDQCLVRLAVLEKDQAAADVAFRRAFEHFKTEIEMPIQLVPIYEEQFQVNGDAWCDLYANQLRKHLERWPNDAMIHNNLAWLLANVEYDLDVALDHAKTAAELVPNDPTYMDTLAEVHFRRGEIREALKLAIRCREIEAKDSHYQNQVQRFTDALLQ